MILNLDQPITVWTATKNGYGGLTFGPPVALEGRWQDKIEQFRTASGDEKVSKSVVYLSVDVAIGDYLFEGTSEAVDPSILTGASEVQQLAKTPDLRTLRTLRKAFL